MNLINIKNRAAEILLIEDNPGDVMLTKEAFKASQFKCNVHVANDGDEALKMLYKQGSYHSFPMPDLILLDLNLPKIDGREILDDIKKDKVLKDIPVIVLSGSDADIDITTSYDLHANSYMVKPDNFNDLKEIVLSIENFWFEKDTCHPNDDAIH